MADAVVACGSCGAKNRVPQVSSGHPRCAKCHTDLPWVVDADDEEFDRAVDTRRLVLVGLWAPWCGPCRMVAPVLETMAREFAPRLKVVKVNVDESPQSASAYGVRGIPNLILFNGGEVKDQIVGAVAKQKLVDAITQVV